MEVGTGSCIVKIIILILLLFPNLHAFVIHKLGGTLDANDVKEGL